MMLHTNHVLGRTLEEIDTMYLQGVLPWQSSKWVAPPWEEVERIRLEAGTHEGPTGVDDIMAAPEDGSKNSQDSDLHKEKKEVTV